MNNIINYIKKNIDKLEEADYIISKQPTINKIKYMQVIEEAVSVRNFVAIRGQDDDLYNYGQIPTPVDIEMILSPRCGSIYVVVYNTPNKNTATKSIVLQLVYNGELALATDDKGHLMIKEYPEQENNYETIFSRFIEDEETNVLITKNVEPVLTLHNINKNSILGHVYTFLLNVEAEIMADGYNDKSTIPTDEENKIIKPRADLHKKSTGGGLFNKRTRKRNTKNNSNSGSMFSRFSKNAANAAKNTTKAVAQNPQMQAIATQAAIQGATAAGVTPGHIANVQQIAQAGQAAYSGDTSMAQQMAMQQAQQIAMQQAQNNIPQQMAQTNQAANLYYTNTPPSPSTLNIGITDINSEIQSDSDDSIITIKLTDLNKCIQNARVVEQTGNNNKTIPSPGSSLMAFADN